MRTCDSGRHAVHLAGFPAGIRSGSHAARIQLMRVEADVVLRFEGRCVGQGCAEQIAAVQSLIRAAAPERLVMDLTYCEQLASPALGLVAFTVMAFAQSGGRVHLVTRNQTFLTTFRVLGLDRHCLLYDGLDEALGRPVRIA